MRPATPKRGDHASKSDNRSFSAAGPPPRRPNWADITDNSSTTPPAPARRLPSYMPKSGIPAPKPCNSQETPPTLGAKARPVAPAKGSYLAVASCSGCPKPFEDDLREAWHRLTNKTFLQELLQSLGGHRHMIPQQQSKPMTKPLTTIP
jgi:hypothetical protein